MFDTRKKIEEEIVEAERLFKGSSAHALEGYGIRLAGLYALLGIHIKHELEQSKG